MAHLAYLGCGAWVELEKAWQNSAQIIAEDVSPREGDTFTDWTSRRGAVENLSMRGLGVKVIRTAMYGQKDYLIVERKGVR